jgi:hypothetical protein
VAAVSAARDERRRARRGSPDGWGWRADAVLRPGLLVHIVNIGPCGALIECRARLRPGRRAELQLVTDREQKLVVPGRIERCEVVALTPLAFRGAIAFDGLLIALAEG